jgi:hypothetical protein
MLEMLNGISQTYFADIHGADQLDPAVHGVPSDIGDGPRFFSIYEDTGYASGEHWDLLTGFLGFVFDDIAFSFSESDCGNPGLMAHLRGLKVEHRYGRSYAEGIAEYVAFAVGLMRRKDFPAHLIDTVQARYAGPSGAAHMREVMRRYAQETYDLSEDQLICMVWAPFVDRGSGLAAYVTAERPALLPAVAEVHDILAAKNDGDPAIRAALVAASGLTIEQLRVLYDRPALGAGRDLLTTILAGDPHTSVIATQHGDGPALEQISGR